MFSSSDWPTIMGANLPSGGPAYPLATPGIRWRFDANKHWSALVAVFNGDPGEQATVNRTGTNFRVNDPPLLMGEVQYRCNQGKDDRGLAGIYRLGGWHHFGEFHDHRFGTDGLACAPLSNGIARRFRGNSGIYGIIDQQIYRPEDGGPDSGISLFSRISATPSDSNQSTSFWTAASSSPACSRAAPTTSSAQASSHANISNQRTGVRPRPDLSFRRRPADPGLRNDDRVELPGPDQAGLDHAAHL